MSSNAPVSLDDVRRYIASHYHESLSIDQLAAMAGLSANYLGEAFKKAYGQRVMEYLTELRIGRAKLLLRDTDLVLRDIARQVGYSDEFYLSRRFKQEVGVSPSIYSRQSRRRIAVLSTSLIGNLLALGIIPVAAPIDPKWSPYYHYYYQSSIHVHLASIDLQDEEGNINKLRIVKPDMLVVHESISDAMRSFIASSGIALVHIEADPWQAGLRELAAALDRSTACEHWIQAYADKVAQAKAHITAAVNGDTFAVLRLSADQIFLYTNRGIRDVLASDLQLNLIDQQQTLCNKQINLEQLNSLQPDRLLLLVCPDAATRTYWLTLQHHPDWRKLKAVSAGQLYLIPSNPWFEYSAVAVIRMLDEMLLMLTGNNPTPSPVPVHGDYVSHEL